MDSKLKQFFDGLKDLVNRVTVERAIKEVDDWDGSAANYSSTEALCNASLINVNPSAGRDDPEDWAQSHCMLPVREEGDASNLFVDKAVFAAAGARGIGAVKRPDDVPEASWDAAVRQAANQLIDAYEQMDRVAPPVVFDAAEKEPPEGAERALGTGDMFMQVDTLLMQAVPGGFPWIMDIFHSAEGVSIVFSDQGLLFSAPVNVDGDDVVSIGEIVQVKQEFTPVGRTVMRQQDDGSWRWFSRSATSVLNRIGVIDSRELFDSFIEHAERTGEYPVRDFYHILDDAFIVGQCDWLGRDGNVLLTSGVYNDSLLAQIEIEARQADPDVWGDSIYFLTLRTDAVEVVEISKGVNVPVYRSGRLTRIATLPESDAASWFTSGVVNRSKVMDPKQFAGLVKLCGDDEGRAKEVMELLGVEELNRQIKETGAVTRSKGESEADPPPAQADAPPIEVDDTVIAAVVEQLEASEVMRQGSETIAAFQEQIGKLQATLEEKAQSFAGRLDVLEEDDDEKRDRYREDLPPRRQQVVYRPSVARAPANGEQPQNLGDKLAANLAATGIE